MWANCPAWHGEPLACRTPRCYSRQPSRMLAVTISWADVVSRTMRRQTYVDSTAGCTGKTSVVERMYIEPGDSSAPCHRRRHRSVQLGIDDVFVERHTATCYHAVNERYVHCEQDWSKDRSLRNFVATSAHRREGRTETNSMAYSLCLWYTNLSTRGCCCISRSLTQLSQQQLVSPCGLMMQVERRGDLEAAGGPRLSFRRYGPGCLRRPWRVRSPLNVRNGTPTEGGSTLVATLAEAEHDARRISRLSSTRSRDFLFVWSSWIHLYWVI